MLFSIVYTAAFFNIALREFAQSLGHKFDFIQQIRDDHPVLTDFQRHLISFMNLCSEQRLPESILWDFIASVIVMDCFPPDIHCKCRARLSYLYAD